MALRRNKLGQFAKGNRGGPGRPRKPPPQPAPVDPLELAIAAELEAQQNALHAQLTADQAASWKVLLARGITPELLKVARQAKSRGMPIPDVLARKLEAPESPRKRSNRRRRP